MDRGLLSRDETIRLEKAKLLPKKEGVKGVMVPAWADAEMNERVTPVAGTPTGFSALPGTSLAHGTGTPPRQQRQCSGLLAVGSPGRHSDYLFRKWL